MLCHITVLLYVRAWGYVVVRMDGSARFAVVQVCGYAARRPTGIGHMALLFSHTLCW